MTREEKMGATEDQALIVHTRKNFKKKEKKDKFHHNKKKDKKQKKTKRDTSNVRCYTVKKRDIFQEIDPSGKRDTMLILSKMVNQQTKDSNERRMIRMKSM